VTREQAEEAAETLRQEERLRSPTESGWYAVEWEGDWIVTDAQESFVFGDRETVTRYADSMNCRGDMMPDGLSLTHKPKTPTPVKG
jgi:hypothetical protein